MTIEQAINDLTDVSRSIAEVAESEEDENNRINAQNFADNCKQLAAWLRELQERRKADSCEGCMHRYGEKLICQMCARYYRDKYVAERRTDGQRTGD